MVGNQEYVIEVEGLSQQFPRKLALKGATLRVPRGTVFGLVGENGAGKTTLVKHLLGLYTPSAGSVRVFGLDPIADPPGVLSRVGYLSEDRDLPDWMRGARADSVYATVLPRLGRPVCGPDAGPLRARPGGQDQDVVARGTGEGRIAGGGRVPSRTVCCSTSRRRGWTRSRDARSWPPSYARWRTKAARSCSPRTCWMKWSACRITWRSCTRAR